MAYNEAKAGYPSDYLHYWWEHYPEGSQFLNSKYFQSKQQILSRQLANSKARRRRLYKRIAATNNVSVDSLGKLYDELKNNPDVFKGEIEQAYQQKNPTNSMTLEQAYGIVSKSDDEWLNELNSGANILFRVANRVVRNNLFKDFSNAVLDNYILKSIEQGRFTVGASRSQAARDLIESFRSSMVDKTLFDISNSLSSDLSKELANLTVQEREILGLLGSISIAQSGGMSVSNWEDIPKQWKNQCSGLAKYADGKAYEKGSAIAFLEATKKGLDAVKNITDDMLGKKVIGGEYITITEELQESETYKRVREEVNKSLKSVASKAVKSDTEVTITNNTVTVDFLRATVKKDFVYQPKGKVQIYGAGTLNLHSNASFVNFLHREMQMSSKDYHSLIQMLVAKVGSSKVDLNAYWEKLKENVAYNGFLSALAGYSWQEQAQFLILKDRIFTIDEIIDRARGLTPDIYPYALYTPNYSRADFLTKWKGNSNPNVSLAIERSEETWADTSRLLNSIILDIKMDLTQNFIASKLS